MEGAYGRLAIDRSPVPSPFYTTFMKLMQQSVRGSVASCIERSFKQVRVTQLIQLFRSPLLERRRCCSSPLRRGSSSSQRLVSGR